MFREIVKDVYIGKSQLGIWVNGKRVPKETLVKDIALPTLLGNKLPDYGTIGNFTQWEFEVNPGGNHKLFITGIPKKTYDLDLYRLKGRLWSSYYEDDKRGYLFQVLPYDIKHLETEDIMETKDYVKIFRLDQENFQFNRGEFMNKMGEDLLEVCQRQQKINPATGHIYYSDFKKVVKHFEDKFNEISRQSIRPLSQNLWKAFFATQVVPLRKLWYPETQKRIEEMKNNSSEQDKKSSRGKKGNYGKGNR